MDRTSLTSKFRRGALEFRPLPRKRGRLKVTPVAASRLRWYHTPPCPNNPKNRKKPAHPSALGWKSWPRVPPQSRATPRQICRKTARSYERYGFEPGWKRADGIHRRSRQILLPDQNRPNEAFSPFQDDDEQWISLR